MYIPKWRVEECNILNYYIFWINKFNKVTSCVLQGVIEPHIPPHWSLTINSSIFTYTSKHNGKLSPSQSKILFWEQTHTNAERDESQDWSPVITTFSRFSPWIRLICLPPSRSLPRPYDGSGSIRGQSFGSCHIEGAT